jgi:hypothetical protein
MCTGFPSEQFTSTLARLTSAQFTNSTLFSATREAFHPRFPPFYIRARDLAVCRFRAKSSPAQAEQAKLRLPKSSVSQEDLPADGTSP